MKVQVKLILLATLVGIVFGSSWDDHKQKHQLSFSSAKENDRRQAIFNSNLDKIKEHNKKAALGLVSYTKRANHLTHLTHAEIVAKYTGYKRDHTKRALLQEEAETLRSARQSNCNCTCPTTTTAKPTTTKPTTTKPTTTKPTTTTTKLTTTGSSTSLDLRGSVMVPPMKDQGSCG